MRLDDYLKNRRSFEVAAWVLFLIVQWLANVLVIRFDSMRSGLDYPLWEPLVLEGSSLLMLGLLIPVLLAFDRCNRLEIGGFRRALPAHLLFSVVFSVAHVFGMVALREVVYALVGTHYDFGFWPRELVYEYLKDVRTYAGFLAIIYLYRFVLLRLQGEARMLDWPAGPDEINPPECIDRVLIKMLGKEFLISLADVDYIEASGNYVNLHVDRSCYPMRSTMARLEQSLDPSRFSRVHRSAIVNLDRIARIEPQENGDARIVLADGRILPFSRRYRAQLRERLHPT